MNAWVAPILDIYHIVHSVWEQNQERLASLIPAGCRHSVMCSYPGTQSQPSRPVSLFWWPLLSPRHGVSVLKSSSSHFPAGCSSLMCCLLSPVYVRRLAHAWQQMPPSLQDDALHVCFTKVYLRSEPSVMANMSFPHGHEHNIKSVFLLPRPQGGARSLKRGPDEKMRNPACWANSPSAFPEALRDHRPPEL